MAKEKMILAGFLLRNTKKLSCLKNIIEPLSKKFERVQEKD